MILRQYEYSRDPCEILISREDAAARRSCNGCTHTLIVFDHRICGKSLTGRYGRRCSAYTEKESSDIDSVQ